MAKYGDTKTCRACGEKTAVLTWIEASTAGFTGGGGEVPATPAFNAWECSECEDREPYSGPIES